MICVIVELSVAPDAVDQLADDSDKVYAEILKTVPGFLFGTLGVERVDRRALGVVYFDSEEALAAAGPVIDGIREAVAISPGVTFTLIPYEVLVSRAGLEPSKLFSPIGGTGTPGSPVGGTGTPGSPVGGTGTPGSPVGGTGTPGTHG